MVEALVKGYGLTGSDAENLRAVGLVGVGRGCMGFEGEAMVGLAGGILYPGALVRLNSSGPTARVVFGSRFESFSAHRCCRGERGHDAEPRQNRRGTGPPPAPSRPHGPTGEPGGAGRGGGELLWWAKRRMAF